ncbi:zinc finger MYM-type protein 1-like protein [Tanacetum coccineum]
MNRHSFVHPHPSSHPLADHLLKLALSLPVATAMVERCFSKMKLLKTDLHNRMGEEYFNGALICAIEKEELINVTNEVVRVYVCVYVDYVGVGTQSIERDRLIGIGVVLDNSFRSLLSDGEMIIEI